ncbi:glycosyltransferase family 4 protein [Patescibacteria group bacterium]|nr:glycosyltransferase family 4 protein [Patescibacteria group bacterium]
MKIVIIGQKGIPAKGGGVEKHVENLAVNLVKAGENVLVYNRINYRPEKLKDYKGVQIINLPTIGSKHLDAIVHTFLSIIHLSTQKIDIIHLHSIGPALLAGLVKLIKPKTKLVFTFHCQDYYHQKWNKVARTMLKFGEKMGHKYADEVIAVSKSLRSYSYRRYNRDVTYIPNAVEKANIIPANIIKEKWGLEKNNYIVSVSRLVRHKGIHYLIEAYKKLNTDKNLVIVGSSSHTDDYVKYLHNLAKDNKNIIFTGLQSGDVLNELFSNAYVFIQPSEEEGLSISLLEALSFKLPIIASNIPANAEVLGDTNILFENKNVDSLKNKMKELINDSDLALRSSEKGKERVEKYFNWPKVSHDIIDVYKKTLL